MFKDIISILDMAGLVGGEGEGRRYGESNMETYVAICKRDSQWQLAM